MTCHQCHKPIPAGGNRGRKYCSKLCYLKRRWDFNEVRPGPGLRRCGHCNKVKSAEDDFYTHGNNKRAGWCKSCRCENERTRRSDVVAVSKFHERYETDMDFRARELLRAVQKRCRKNGTKFDLDVPWMAERLRGRCELTGLEFDMSVRSRKPTLYTPSLDRIKPGEGYTRDNCRVVIFGINLWMKDFTLEAIMPIAWALLTHSGQRRSVA